VYNLIPNFIQEKYIDRKYLGEFEAATVFMDIIGFTSMTEKLMRHGKEGAEVLNNILNSIFEPVIDLVYVRKGFISSFAGDAFTAIFPIDISSDSREQSKLPISSICTNAVYSAISILEIFEDIGKKKTRFGNFDIFIKIGLSFGKVQWGISGSDLYKTYYFRGNSIDGCARSSKNCTRMQIVDENGLLVITSRKKQLR